MIRVLLFLLICAPLFGQNDLEVVVDVKEPILQEGVLTTTEGGIITAEGIRIQAKNIVFTRKEVDGERMVMVEASGDLMVEYGEYALIGDCLEYNFVTREGTLSNARSALGLWYVAGRVVHLCADETYLIEDASITTCENADSEWSLKARRIRIREGGWISADFVSVTFLRAPIFYLPNFRTNLHALLDAPIRYRAQVAGIRGSRVGLRYRFLTLGDLIAYLRLEYIIGRGPAGGIETEYCPPGTCRRALTQSYITHDRSINDPHERVRYRFAGTYDDLLLGGDLQLRAAYDVLSDREMPQDYRTSDFNLHTAHLTYFRARHESPYSVSNLTARVRVNTFQTVTQELPTLEINARPLSLGPTGLIWDNHLSISYLDQIFARETNFASFHSGRAEATTSLCQPIVTPWISIVPEGRFTAIAYSNSPGNDAQLLAVGEINLDLSSKLSAASSCFKHVIEPYIHFNYSTSPSSQIPDHYIFSIEDGYGNIKLTRFGLRNAFFQRATCFLPTQVLEADLYAYAFIDATTVVGAIPRIYLDGTWKATSWLTLGVYSAWNVAHKRIDHLNPFLACTFSKDLALRVEYRTRSPFDWKKSDRTSFTLDTFVEEGTLLASPLSDRRETLLTHLFWRLTPTLTAELQTRNGWKRSTEPSYSEGRLTLRTILRGRWRVSVYYEWAEVDNRMGLSLSLGKGKRPYARKPRPVW